MRIEIICTGDEVLTGATVNTNFSYISQKLGDVGLEVRWGTTVGDDRDTLLQAFRIAGERVIIAEDTPHSRIDRIMNTGWDWLLNWRHGVPTPFTFRSADEWVDVFKGRDLSIASVETYRPKWPTLMTYPHTLFVLDR
jgi:hypothetical protein